MSRRCSLALVSLPGARLQDLAQAISPDLGLPVIGAEDFGSWSPHCTPAVFVLPSDVLESGATDRVEDFRHAGNPVFFLDLPWEDSWHAMNPENLHDPNGLPWRAAYRRLSKSRREQLMAHADHTVDVDGTFTELAHRLLKVITANGYS